MSPGHQNHSPEHQFPQLFSYLTTEPPPVGVKLYSISMVPTEVFPVTEIPRATPLLTCKVTWKGNMGELMVESPLAVLITI